jgi:hypothetical protein
VPPFLSSTFVEEDLGTFVRRTSVMPLHGIKQFFSTLTVCTLITSLGVPPSVSAQAHIVSQEELHSALIAAAQSREKNREKIASALSTPKAEKALRGARLDVKQVTAAVASLSDAELARLAAQLHKTEADFAAGRLSERDLLWILVGIAALILIIVAVR